MADTYRLKVAKIELVRDQHGELDTYIAKKSGKTIYKTLVVFENGSKGIFDHEGQTQDYFKVGEVSEFRVQKNDYGTKLYRINKSGGGNHYPKGWVPRAPAEVKRENLGFIMQDVTKLVIADKLPLDQMVEKFNELSDAFFAKVDSVTED